MLISYHKKFLFVHIFKTAGTSITDSLARFCYRPDSTRPSNWMAFFSTNWTKIHRKPIKKHATATEIRDSLDREIFNSVFKFTFVRNPWDWQVSLYHYILENPENHGYEETMKMGSFRNFVFSREKLSFTQTSCLVDESGNLLVDFVGKFENLDQDFQSICRKVGIAACLPHINKSKRTDYQDYYDAETRDLTARLYAEDIERFGYTF
ncbi:MAG: sulfotransferase family 2 domain-containing protein [Verrucomicrobia bacterium]|nr:sulfotransferase family 2 domain-containing protein [Verrucomicrobiota bacterium]